MSSINSEISRLKNKDVRTRRRALRALFDIDSPTALPAFVPLLEDNDPWFRTKALDAHRKWAKNSSDLEALVEGDKECQRVAAELCSEIGDTEIATTLFQSEDWTTRSFAARALSDDSKMVEEMAGDSHHSVRMIAGEFSKDSDIISMLMEDGHSSVRRTALATASREGLAVKESTLTKALGTSDPSLRSLAAAMTVEQGGKLLAKACKDSNPKVRKAIADQLRIVTKDVDERVELVATTSPEIIIRWLRSRHDPRSTKLRWRLIADTNVDARIRSKLLEQMSGRPKIDVNKLAILTEDDSALVRLAANNLSAAVSELSGERV